MGNGAAEVAGGHRGPVLAGLAPAPGYCAARAMSTRYPVNVRLGLPAVGAVQLLDLARPGRPVEDAGVVGPGRVRAVRGPDTRHGAAHLGERLFVLVVFLGVGHGCRELRGEAAGQPVTVDRGVGSPVDGFAR